VHDDGYFDEEIAATYDDDSAEMFDPATLDPVVDFLAELAGAGRALELGMGREGSPSRSRGVGSRSTGSSCRRRWSHGCARSPAGRRSA
jgi:hypothetical protein